MDFPKPQPTPHFHPEADAWLRKNYKTEAEYAAFVRRLVRELDKVPEHKRAAAAMRIANEEIKKFGPPGA